MRHHLFHFSFSRIFFNLFWKIMLGITQPISSSLSNSVKPIWLKWFSQGMQNLQNGGYILLTYKNHHERNIILLSIASVLSLEDYKSIKNHYVWFLCPNCSLSSPKWQRKYMQWIWKFIQSQGIWKAETLLFHQSV